MCQNGLAGVLFSTTWLGHFRPEHTELMWQDIRVSVYELAWIHLGRARPRQHFLPGLRFPENGRLRTLLMISLHVALVSLPLWQVGFTRDATISLNDHPASAHVLSTNGDAHRGKYCRVIYTNSIFKLSSLIVDMYDHGIPSCSGFRKGAALAHVADRQKGKRIINWLATFHFCLRTMIARTVAVPKLLVINELKSGLVKMTSIGLTEVLEGRDEGRGYNRSDGWDV